MSKVAKKGLSLQYKVFGALLGIAIFCVTGTTIFTYLITKNAAERHVATSLQNKANTLFTSLDYAIEDSGATQANLREVLKSKLLEIADINKIDVIIYDTDGYFLVSNKDDDLILQKQIPEKLLLEILDSPTGGYDLKYFDKEKQATMISSYRVLQESNSLNPMAIAYFPSYYTSNRYLDIFNKYLLYIFMLNIIAGIISGFISWRISKTITRSISAISQRIASEGTDLKPILYSHNDELSVLVRAYNKMIYQQREQTELKTQVEREKAWREMAKQVAHEVKNPLTPMKLSIQNFERKFDPEDPDIRKKLHKVTQTMVTQIDMIAKVAGAFSEFAKLPEKKDVKLELNQELQEIVQVFDQGDIKVEIEENPLYIIFDKIYLQRVITNLITNAQQAEHSDRTPQIFIRVQRMARNRISMVVQDNGVGISKSALEQIFEPNFTTKSSGMGLGLTMSRKMIGEYKGTISVKSEEGVGTTFTIVLPTGFA